MAYRFTSKSLFIGISVRVLGEEGGEKIIFDDLGIKIRNWTPKRNFFILIYYFPTNLHWFPPNSAYKTPLKKFAPREKMK